MSGGKPSNTVRALIVGAALLTIAAIVVVSTSLLAHRQRDQGGQSGLCPNLEIDRTTGQIRDKGLIPCGRFSAQNERLDLIRDSFKGR
jgi:hypothetical protein